MKKISSALIIMMILFVSISVLIGMVSSGGMKTEGTFFDSFENSVSENLPFRDSLSDLMGRIRYFSGVRHFGNIYIGSDGSLIKEIESPTSRTFSAAKSYVSGYAEKHQIKPYFMLVPTAAAILQHETDDFVREEIYNQRGMINQMYSLFEGKVRTTDVYQMLLDHKDEYIFYHTEDIPTSLGGYYIYSELCDRLDLRMNTMDSFSAAYAAHDFYGSLSDEFFRPYASADFITLYEYTGKNCSFSVKHIRPDGKTSFSESLFIYDENALSDKTDMVLGGLSAITEIARSESDDVRGSILIFGDESAKSWLPFLASNYSKITFVDLDLVTVTMLSEIVTAEYDHVLFAYSTAAFSEGINFSNLEFVG
ncbi:MAG: hypothetical protein IJ283_04240 [Oscillospiraceae bacterium]|nr:hypothetical protein [Oscillospiraceae bacterium]